MTLVIILAGLMLLGVAAALAMHAFALPRLRSLQRLDQISSYGVLEGSDAGLLSGESRGTPHRIATAVGRLVSGNGRMDLAETGRLLRSAGRYQTDPATVLGYRVLVTAALGLVALTMGFDSLMSVVTALALPLLGWVVPQFLLKRIATSRADAIDRALPDLVDLLVVTVEAGLSFSGALRTATERISGPVQDELRLALQEERMGLPTNDALANMVGRCDTQSVRAFVQSVTQSEKLGVSMGQMLRGLAVEMRKRKRSETEVRAQKAPIKMLFPLAFLIFPALLVVIVAPAVITFMEVFPG